MMKTKKYLIPAVCCLLLAAFLVIAPVAATDSVSSHADWQKYVVEKAANHEDVDVVLTSDIALNDTAGTESGYLKNVKINGNGHTITLNLTEGIVDNVALLGYIKDGHVEVSDLKLSGTISMKENEGKNRAAALIGYANGGEYILNKVELNGMNISYGGTVGGLIGYAGNEAIVSMNGCNIKNSKIATTNGYFAGGFLGWGADGTTCSFKDCTMETSYVSGSKVPSGGIAGCLAGTNDISGCSISGKSEIYSAYGQTGGLVGYLAGILSVHDTKIADSTIIATGVPAQKQGASTRAVVTNKNIGVGGFIGEMATPDKDGIPQSSLTATSSSITSCQILSNRGDQLGEVVGNGYPGTTVPGVTLTGNTVKEINQNDNPAYYVGHATPKAVSTPLPLLGILAGLAIAGLIARKRKTE